MKKTLFLFAFLFIALAAFAQVTVVSDVPMAAAPLKDAAGWPDTIIITAALAASILTVTEGIKKLLESPILVWILRLMGHSEVIPFISILIAVATGIIGGIIAYGADGISIREVGLIIMAIVSAMGGHALVAKASGK